MSNDNSSSLKSNSNGNNKIEPEPQPSEPNLKKNNVKDINFYKGLYCALLYSEGMNEDEATALFNANIFNLMKMRELNPDKLSWFIYGRRANIDDVRISDDDIFVYALKKLKEAKLHGHIFDAVLAHSL